MRILKFTGSYLSARANGWHHAACTRYARQAKGRAWRDLDPSERVHAYLIVLSLAAIVFIAQKFWRFL